MSLRRYAGSGESVVDEDPHILHFGCDGSVCADTSDISNSQVSLSDLAFAMEFHTSELVEPPTLTHAADIHPLPPRTLLAKSAACTSETQVRTASVKQLQSVGDDVWQTLGHSLSDVAATDAINQAQIAVIAAIMHNTTLPASKKHQRALALCSGQMMMIAFIIALREIM
eukprot:CAMPEP_0173091142 /NCGR_PEP_ID=MMETSP1102-20130122/27634_1 /TAXON_ID=49646 /ORGANISM="Geminigera sp., Strain Caron Lab Isolate" /LENGTH=169 /DNA_ID=CAMNT_0013976741 /DNA_START=36 /DNA_END=545 /DNA_ORIENTATION=+